MKRETPDTRIEQIVVLSGKSEVNIDLEPDTEPIQLQWSAEVELKGVDRKLAAVTDKLGHVERRKSIIEAAIRRPSQEPDRIERLHEGLFEAMLESERLQQSKAALVERRKTIQKMLHVRPVGRKAS